MEFDSLRESHIDGIAEILMQNYAAAAAALPLMPPGFESAEQIAARMKKHAGDEGFVVALDGEGSRASSALTIYPATRAPRRARSALPTCTASRRGTTNVMSTMNCTGALRACGRAAARTRTRFRFTVMTRSL